MSKEKNIFLKKGAVVVFINGIRYTIPLSGYYYLDPNLVREILYNEIK